ncbi:energy-coupling factor transporter transmembrane protein EcfT [uncultured Desulfovibrio sp.]|uniref:energy-coupling factor transporter transmembrane component T family protein n=1 Tax=uncultured Desulfovibrio sp. TaxID=167968 RepID=UPI002711DE84|nr:energy-coupling factor transporter transmembrane component T [uncultured Desulfovibrio sp.]
MFDQPFVRPSLFQAIDPRVRLACAALTAVCLAPLKNLPACCLGLALGLTLLIISRPPFLPLLRRLAAVNIFILFLWCVTPWTTPGTVLAQWGIFAVSAEGVRLSLLASVKSNALVCVFLALVASMNSPTVGHALERLRCPRKLVFLFLFTGRYAHVLASEWRTLSVAARLRGFRPRTDLHTYRTLACLLGLLLVRAYERSLRVREAMLLRGFEGRFRSVAVFRIRPVDALFALSLLLCLTGIVWMEWKGGPHV